MYHKRNDETGERILTPYKCFACGKIIAHAGTEAWQVSRGIKRHYAFYHSRKTREEGGTRPPALAQAAGPEHSELEGGNPPEPMAPALPAGPESGTAETPLTQQQ